MYRQREGRRAASSWPAWTLLAIAALPWSPAWPQALSPHPATIPSPRALADQYCIGCHNQKTSTAGFSLEGLDFSNTTANAAILERVIRKVGSGEMPPAGMPRPAAPVAT